MKPSHTFAVVIAALLLPSLAIASGAADNANIAHDGTDQIAGVLLYTFLAAMLTGVRP